MLSKLTSFADKNAKKILVAAIIFLLIATILHYYKRYLSVSICKRVMAYWDSTGGLDGYSAIERIGLYNDIIDTMSRNNFIDVYKTSKASDSELEKALSK